MKVLYILSLLLVMNSCNLTKKMDKEDAILISMRKTMCRGECPVYSVVIYNSGILKYEGKKYVSKVGNLEKKLTRSEMKTLKKAFDTADFFSFEEEYTGRVTDMPSTYLSYTLGEISKTVRNHFGGPSELKVLEDKVAALVVEWVK